MSRHEDRQQMALESGATAVVAERGEEALPRCEKFSVVEQMQLSNVWVLKQPSTKLSVFSIMAGV